ncbi:MAG: hypothetical protein LBO09_01745 [Candidatus Peribacteria bacterium]|jgi:hypothetical protein|nr:hypothetical protein [Candidatus Peribacteria bacterium]
METIQPLTISSVSELLEQSNYTQKEIRQIFESYQWNLEEILQQKKMLPKNFSQLQEFFIQGRVLNGHLNNIPIDGLDSLYCEGGISNAFVAEVSDLIKQQFPDREIGKLIDAGLIKRERLGIGTKNKMQDTDPFVDGSILVAKINDRNVAILFSSRNPLNHAMIDFVIYLDSIQELCGKLLHF